MSANIDSVAKYIAEKSDWSISNLKLQKMMYITQMIHMGRNDGECIFNADFQAWDYGPVIPSLYHRLKIFGSNPISDVLSRAKKFRPDDARRKVMNDVCKRFLKFSAGDLVEITHADIGAWAEFYVPGARNITIPNEAILDEYRLRNA
ncbi:Panacea domain-containing protein [bacterium]|nr:Panacea domain-containing protein [bacterium]